jgi:4-hydroxy-tetrahydrodipicolinate synthase
MSEKWMGLNPAIMVPLNADYSVNEKELRNYVEWLITYKHITGLVTNGHTGEISGFNREERKLITKIVADQAKGRVRVISGVCAEGTFEAIDHAKDAQDAGADGILLMPPHVWLRFGMKPETPVKFMQDVAVAIDIKIVVHLYPANTKGFYPVQTLLELAKIPNVVAVKMGTRDEALYERDIRIMREKAPHIALWTCHDEYLMTSLIPGLDGALIGFCGCVPELINNLYQKVLEGDLKQIREANEPVSRMSAAIYGTGEPTGEAHARMKEVLYQRGIFSSALMRPPLLPLSQEEKDGVTAAIKLGKVGKIDLA